MSEIDYATCLRQWADVAPMGHEHAILMRGAAGEIERLRISSGSV